MDDALILEDWIDGITREFERTSVLVLILLMERLPKGFWIFADPIVNCDKVGAEIVLYTSSTFARVYPEAIKRCVLKYGV